VVYPKNEEIATREITAKINENASKGGLFIENS
jgi:hypothetical protein